MPPMDESHEHHVFHAVGPRETYDGRTDSAPAAAQSLHQKQQNYLDKVVDMTGKPMSEITKEEAQDLYKKESRARAGVPPKRGSLSDQAQEAAKMNEKKGNG
ncbi:hypothetical protein ACRALDRAFT_1067951 [Sodiomyces alcalophilus JCM 7366]|uniref:uncharacterized protein n=1 Tax=Sodiomyces alcalophilus JCM 7366 TaxID=591952 RepID=UPI0039B660AF